MNKKVLYLVHGAVIAALYVVLTMLANALGLANYPIQVRFSYLPLLPYRDFSWDVSSAIP